MLKAAVLGATGNVGQIFIQLLEDHPWFEVTDVAASERSKGRMYSEASRWRQTTPIPEAVKQMEVADINPKEIGDVDIVFSALPSSVAGKVEEKFATAGYVIVSNASAHRMDLDVPMLNPEINCSHISLIEEQRKRRNWDGAIITNPNCSTTVITLPLKPIFDQFGINSIIVSTMQAISGAGYPGVASLDIVDNVIPFIGGEESKVELESQKILGTASEPADFKVSASCHRVPTINGHMAAVFVNTKKDAKPNDVAKAMEDFIGEPQLLKLPSAPEKPVVVTWEKDRPQTRLDRMEGNGMSTIVGRIRRDHVIDGVKFIALGHNTIRGAAGCGILNTEYLKVKKVI